MTSIYTFHEKKLTINDINKIVNDMLWRNDYNKYI